MKLMKKFVGYPFVRGIFAILWMLLLTVLLLQPENQPLIPTGVQAAPPSLGRELLFSSMHLLTFAMTAWLWCFALDLKSDNKRRIVILVVLLLTYGLSVEYLQSSVPGRTAQWWDMLANSIGIISACFIWIWFQRQIETQEHSNCQSAIQPVS